MMTRPIGGCDDERARPSTGSRPIDRSFASIESSSSTVRIVATEDSFIHSIARSVRRSVDGWNGMEWNGMDGHHIHPSTHTYIQTDDTYIHDNRPIIIYYIQRARDRPTHAPHHHLAPPRARATSHDDDDCCRRSSVVDATPDSRDDGGTNERTNASLASRSVTTMPRDDDDDDDDAHRRSTRDVDEGATRPRDDDDDAEDADDDDVQRRAVMMEKTKRSVESTDDADASKRESEDATDATDDRDDDARATPARQRRDRGARRDLGGDAASEDARYRTVFVGGVHHECDEERLREFFESEHGEVESVKMIYDRMTSARKGYGFVKFREGGVADAVRALEKVTIEGKAVDVKEATRDEPVAAIVGGGRSQGEEGGRARAGRGGRMSRGGSRESLSDVSLGGGGGGNASTTVGTVGGARRGVVNGDARRSNGVAIVGGRGYAERVVKTSVKPHAMARSPKYVGALEDGASESESGGSGTTSTPAPGTENTVFVGGLPMEASPESLGWYFAHYGTVLSVKLIYDKHTGQSKGYGFIVFADVAVAEMIKAHRQMPFMGKMIDVSEAMRHVGRPDDGRGYAPPYGGLKYGAHGPFYPPQMMYPPHMPMMPGQGPGVPMMFPHPMQFAGYSPMYGSIPYGVAPPTEVEKEAETAAAETPTNAASDE